MTAPLQGVTAPEAPRQKFRKTALVEAVQFTREMAEGSVPLPAGVQMASRNLGQNGRFPDYADKPPLTNFQSCHRHYIETLEGNMLVEIGDWVAGPGARGEFWPIKPDVFAATYEPAATPPQPSGQVQPPVASDWVEQAVRLAAEAAIDMTMTGAQAKLHTLRLFLQQQEAAMQELEQMAAAPAVQPPVAQGMRLVPVEPTEAMLTAGVEWLRGSKQEPLSVYVRGMWNRMLGVSEITASLAAAPGAAAPTCCNGVGTCSSPSPEACKAAQPSPQEAAVAAPTDALRKECDLQQRIIPEGDWLWGKLMEWCKKRRVHPREYNDLFAIVSDARHAGSELAGGAPAGAPAVAIGEVNCHERDGMPVIRLYPAAKRAPIGAQVFASAGKPAPLPGGVARVKLLERALVYSAHHQHGTPQHMLPKGVTLYDNDGVKITLPSGESVTAYDREVSAALERAAIAKATSSAPLPDSGNGGQT